jgi:hypothetical protein
MHIVYYQLLINSTIYSLQSNEVRRLIDAAVHSEHDVLIWFDIGAKSVERFWTWMSNEMNCKHSAHIYQYVWYTIKQ